MVCPTGPIEVNAIYLELNTYDVTKLDGIS